jgi:ubiquinone/menaquinone biosynthesis C-methylase UbiE
MRADLQKIEQATIASVASGHLVLQAHRFADNDFAHVRRLVQWSEIPDGSSVIDMGSGVGEVARIWSMIHPTTRFRLVNISPLQLSLSPPDIPSHCCDMTSVPEPDCAFDAAICCFAIGHVDHADAFREMFRLVRPGGTVFVYDMVRIFGGNERMRSIGYEVHARSATEAAARSAGLSLDFYMEPTDRGWFGRKAMGADFDHYFHGVKPAIWRFRRPDAPV